VLLGHFLLGQVTWLAPLGVELFFVLSGRLMADILFVERFPLGEFYKRRFSRIYPGLLAFVLITWAWTRTTDLAFKPFAVATALTFTINYAMILKHGVSAIENLWSLCIEEHAYVLLGLVALLARRKGWKPIWVLVGGAGLSMIDAVTSSAVLHQSYFGVYWRTDAHLTSIFAAGAAYLLLRDRRQPPWLCPVALVVAIVVMALTPNYVRYSLGTLLLALAVASIDQTWAPVRAAVSRPWLTTLGVWSYSLYLWQQPLYRLEFEGRILSPLALTIAVICGVVSFYLVEQPARRWLNRHLAWPARPAPARGVSTPT
jgi:peptidoglycan/LPS O-acetylase OafA/YrhL